MSGFFAELGKQLADRWLKLLVLPGLLFVAVVLAGTTLGQRHAFDLPQTARQAEKLTTASHNVTAAALLIAGVLVASGAAGLLANVLAAAADRAWLGTWPRPLGWVASWRVKKRRKRWSSLSAEIDRAEDPVPLMVKRAGYAYAAPRRPTWMGDRLCGVDAVVYQEYRLDLDVAWPRFWLLFPAEVKAELVAARAAYDRAAALGGWGMLYCGAGIVWWPAAVAGLLTFCTGWIQARDRVDQYAALAEAAVDLYIVQLAESLPDSPQNGGFHHDLGAPITKLLRKGG
ncbi:hypothetical protein ACFORO_36190 [Amycolatopsis halotolerans]|uniref:Uncharacterized protein n=1 Tax=Amycolatopsis halotolerans TaxID=330083 RepID=A0ABV7QWS7_9PSEU